MEEAEVQQMHNFDFEMFRRGTYTGCVEKTRSLARYVEERCRPQPVRVSFAAGQVNALIKSVTIRLAGAKPRPPGVVSTRCGFLVQISQLLCPREERQMRKTKILNKHFSLQL